MVESVERRVQGTCRVITRVALSASLFGSLAALFLVGCQATLPRTAVDSLGKAPRAERPAVNDERGAARDGNPSAASAPGARARSDDGSVSRIVVPPPDATRIPAWTPTEPDLWRRLRAGFEFVECEPAESMRASLQHFTAHPDAFGRIFDNAATQLDYVARRLADADIPAEFALLPMVESRYLVYPHVPGTRGPAGPWQLMPRTARAFGLRVDRAYDDRLDLVASTQAAIRLLHSLHAQFNDWSLVILAFNAGDGRVRGALRRAGGWHGDPYSLRLSPITRAHFSRLRALVCICADPARHGLSLPAAPATRLHASPVRDGQDIAAMAVDLGLGHGDLSRLNPMLAGKARVPRGMRAVLVPRPVADALPGPSASAAAAAATTVDVSDASAPLTPATHVVAKGDSLWTVARRYRITLDDLRRWNALNARALLRPGQVLRLTGH